MMAALNRRLLQPGERIRVMVVDDSVVIRRLVSQVLEQDAMIEVVGTASNGHIGLQRIPQLNPDLITLDIEMPGMNGLEMLRGIRRDYPHLRVVMFSTLTERGAAITLEALTLGADDYVTKASNEGSLDRSLMRLREEMIPKIKQFFCPAIPAIGAIAAKGKPTGPALQSKRVRARVLAIGVSTGGPAALSEMLPALPANFPLPVLLVQHMPPVFTRLLAERLNATCKLKVQEASNGQAIEAGKILIAPGDFHMKVTSGASGAHISLDQSPRQNSCRPAVDALFASVAETYGGDAVAVILTGMGRDGLHGVEMLRARGALILAQDQASSVVWGMPGAVTNAGFADRVLPLNAMVTEILGIIGEH